MALAHIAVRPTAPVSSRPLVLGPPPTTTRPAVGLSTADAVQLSGVSQAKGQLPFTGVMDLPNRAPKVENPLLTQTQGQIINSPAFTNVYRGFDLLSPRQQQASLQKLKLFQQKYPQFLDVLNHVPNSRYGDGFQFFIVPPEADKRWKDVPAAVRGTGGPVGYSGIVFASPALALSKNDSKLKMALHYLSQGGVDAFSAVKPGMVDLDVGGMFTNSSEDTFAHEMGHVLHAYFMSNPDKLELWAIYTEAKQNDKGFITDYARTNHMEFFAEGVESYLKQDAQGHFIERESLNQTNPRLFAFVQKQLDPAIAGPEPEALKAAWTVTSGKAKDSFKAIRNLFSKAP